MDETLFVGREEELYDLKQLLHKKSASLVVIKGRRRIGKSRLIEEFAKGKRFLRFEGLAPTRNTTAQMQRAEFARQLHLQMGLPGLESVKDWGDLLTNLAQNIKKEPVVVLLDEITWMGSKDSTFLSKLKIVWDQYFQKNSNLILILCGSLSFWIEKNIVNSTGFVGRISLKIHLQELSLQECNTLLNKLGYKRSAQEKLFALAVTGGVPWYIEQMNSRISVQENIRKLCFQPNGLFVEEFHHIFHDLFGKRLPICKKIVTALKEGSKEYKEIAQDIHYASGGPLSEYLEDLITSGFLAEQHSWDLFSGSERKSCKYRIQDNYLRYYLKYIFPHLSKIKKGLFTTISPFDLPGWEGVMGLQFENIVLHNRKEIWKALGLRPQDILFENPYFQSQTSKQVGCQIDYMIQTRFKNLYLCEIKFSHHPISGVVISEVTKKTQALNIPKGFAVLPVLIHASGTCKAIDDAQFFANVIDFRELLK
ncbi:MAG: AAA family ATPase [Rhabdochlamydiaceae bacterium]|nr:AAA family ATPase [Rhabdochlamydiaceae bacterium]